MQAETHSMRSNGIPCTDKFDPKPYSLFRSWSNIGGNLYRNAVNVAINLMTGMDTDIPMGHVVPAWHDV